MLEQPSPQQYLRHDAETFRVAEELMMLSNCAVTSSVGTSPTVPHFDKLHGFSGRFDQVRVASALWRALYEAAAYEFCVVLDRLLSRTAVSSARNTRSRTVGEQWIFADSVCFLLYGWHELIPASATVATDTSRKR